MKFKQLKFLGLLAIIALSGCTSSPTPEEEASLIEYENCLETELQKWVLRGTNDNWSGTTLDRINDQLKADNMTLSEYFIESCKKLRP